MNRCAGVPLKVSLMCVCVEMWLRSVAQRCFQKCRSGVPLSVAQKCSPEVSQRSVTWECRSKDMCVECRASLKSVANMCVCVCVAQKCLSKVLLRGVDQKCCSEVSIRRVSLRSVIKSVAQGYRSLLRGVAQKCRSGVSHLSATSLELSPLCSTSLVRKAQASSSSGKIATLCSTNLPAPAGKSRFYVAQV